MKMQQGGEIPDELITSNEEAIASYRFLTNEELECLMERRVGVQRKRMRFLERRRDLK